MTKKRKNEGVRQPQGKLTRIPDFLPSSDELQSKEATVKITVEVDSETLTFFKENAHQSGLKYQRLIGEALKSFARKYG